MADPGTSSVPGFGDDSPSARGDDPVPSPTAAKPEPQTDEAGGGSQSGLAGYKPVDSTGSSSNADKAVVEKLSSFFARLLDIRAVRLLSFESPVPSGLFVGPLFGIAVALALFGLGPAELATLAVLVAVPALGCLRLLTHLGVDWRGLVPAIGSPQHAGSADGAPGQDAGDPSAMHASGSESVGAASEPAKTLPQLQQLLPAEHLSGAADGIARWISSGIAAVDRAAAWVNPHRSVRTICVCWLAYSYMWLVTGRLSPLVVLALAVGAATGYRLFKSEVDSVARQHVAPWVPKVGSVAALIRLGLKGGVDQVGKVLGAAERAADGSPSRAPEEETASGPEMLATAGGLGLLVYLFWSSLSLAGLFSLLSAVVVLTELLAPLAGDRIRLAGFSAGAGASEGGSKSKKE